MIIEVIGASVTAIVWAGLHYANAIHRRAHEAEMLSDPARCRARRRGIERRREILMRQRDEYERSRKVRKTDLEARNDWRCLIAIDKDLDKLAREEADIPLLGDLEQEAE